MARLAHATILVTRPLSQARALIQAIGEAGGRAIHLPTMVITPYKVLFPHGNGDEINKIKTVVMNADQYDIAICISVTSATCMLSWLDDYWPQMPVGIQWAAVGRATADVLVSAGLDVSYPDQLMDSGGLLKLPLLADVSNKKVVLFKGRGGRDILQTELQARGATVHVCELYQRTAAVDNAVELKSLLRQRCITAITGHSTEMIEFFFTLLGNDNEARDQLLDLPLIVPGDRVATQARQLGFTRVVMAENATTGPMLEALSQLGQ